MNLRILGFVIVVIIIALIGFGVFTSNQFLIYRVIKGALAKKGEVMARGAFKSYEVYQEGNSDVVVFEYVFHSNTVIDYSYLNITTLKAEVLKSIRALSPKEINEIRLILNKGISLKYIYKQRGKIIETAIIKKNDI